MAGRKASKQVLGVMVTGRTVNAVLLEAGPDGVQALRQFTRQRSSRFSSAQMALPELQGADGEPDFSVQFTNAASAEDMFLGSEFGGIEAVVKEEEQSEATTTFSLELGDLLAECRDAGYVDPAVAFCSSAAEVNQVELVMMGAHASGSEDGDKKRKKTSVSRGALLEQLRQQYKSKFEEETVAFLPLTDSEEGFKRFLALFPRDNDPVSATIRAMREQHARRLPAFRLLDTEVPLYLGMARAALGLTKHRSKQTDALPGHTLIVRAGSEDTLVLFLRDGELQQSENLRSLTAYEAPETICSRVLLLQDEYGVGDVQHVLLLSEEREDDLIESFEMFFPDANVESLRQYVPEFDMGTSKVVAAGALLPAVGVALRLLDDERYKNVFEDVNLLPKQLQRRQINLPVTWHVLTLFVLLFCTVLFFMARFFALENKIVSYERNISEFQSEFQDELGPVSLDASTLQHKIDSLQAMHSRYMRSLNVLEGLLQGSDRWSRALEKTSDEVSKVTGIWIESWNPRGTSLELVGNATGRDQVVALAGQLDGSIGSLTFSEIREWPVYSFKMTIPLENGLPQAAEFLREQVMQAEQRAAENIPVTSTALSQK